MFFRNTLDSRTYVNGILTIFIKELTDTERDFAFLQKDSATARIADIERVFNERIISRDLWPARSPDMTPLNFYLWGRLKNAVYTHVHKWLPEISRNSSTP